MKKEDVVQELRKRFDGADTSGIDGTVAIQIDLKDDDGGTLYVEVKDKVLSIEPYEYWDRNAIITIASKDLLAIIDKKVDVEKAFSDGVFNVEGDTEKILELVKLSKKIVVKEEEIKPNIKNKEVIEKEKLNVKPVSTVKLAVNRSNSKTTGKSASKSKSKAKIK